MQQTTHAPRIYFGGPDLAPHRLRDLLADRVAAVPSGGAIDWVTYYFRDRRLAEALIAARRRGVDVRITLEGRPRTERANDAVFDLLSGEAGLGSGLRSVGGSRDPRSGDGPGRPRLHEKLYCFSHPRPVAMIGSFNPSGDVPEAHPEVIEQIGDQDRGHNFLAELDDSELVEPLVEHARHLHMSRHRFADRFGRRANAAIEAGSIALHLWPRSTPHPVDRLLAPLGAGARVRIASSHLKGRGARRTLCALARRGARVEILAEHTERRVPETTLRALVDAGIGVRRVVDGDDPVPMHNKFCLVETPGVRWTVFGSFNWTSRSRRFNREIGAVCRDCPDLFAAFEARWQVMNEGAVEARAATA